MIRCDKTFSELWNLTEHKNTLIAEAAHMAIKTINEFREENRKQQQEIENLKNENFLVYQKGYKQGKYDVEMDHLNGKTEEDVFPDTQNLTSICLKCGIDLSNCICSKKDKENPFFKGYRPDFYFRTTKLKEGRS